MVWHAEGPGFHPQHRTIQLEKVGTVAHVCPSNRETSRFKSTQRTQRVLNNKTLGRTDPHLQIIGL